VAVVCPATAHGAPRAPAVLLAQTSRLATAPKRHHQLPNVVPTTIAAQHLQLGSYTPVCWATEPAKQIQLQQRGRRLLPLPTLHQELRLLARHSRPAAVQLPAVRAAPVPRRLHVMALTGRMH